MHWNTTCSTKEIIHVYLRDAKGLRPDRKTLPAIPESEIEAVLKDLDINSLKFDPDGIRK
jgi:chorismate mutase